MSAKDRERQARVSDLIVGAALIVAALLALGFLGFLASKAEACQEQGGAYVRTLTGMKCIRAASLPG